MRLGVHVSIAGGLPHALARATQLGCTTMQIFTRSPRGGPAPTYPLSVVHTFDIARRAAGIAPLIVHGPYIINLASPERGMWQMAVRLFREEYRRAARLNADFLVTHMGSHKGQGEAIGIERISTAINRVLSGTRLPTMILLENSAGSGVGFGDRFEQLAVIRDRIQAKERIGVCLDTAHLFAAGYPIHTAQGLDETLTTFDNTVGLEHLHVIHLNDSRSGFGSRVDRHWHIGEGCLGREAFRRILQEPRLRGVPLILETPKSDDRADRRNLSTVKALSVSRPRVRRSLSGVR